MRLPLAAIFIAALLATQVSAQQYWLLPTVPTPRPVVVQPVVVQPLKYERTIAVPRMTYFGNRFFGPVIYHQFAPVVAPQAPVAGDGEGAAK